MLIREKLEEDPFSAELRTLLEACLQFDLLRPSSLLARICSPSDEAAENLERMLETPANPGSRDELSEKAHQILNAWVSLIYVDGGYKKNGRSAWALYDLKRDQVQSGRGHCSSSTEAEWNAVLQGCRYASSLSESLVLIYSDAHSILEQIERVDAQTEDQRDFAWMKYRNPKLLELYDYLDAYPIDLLWASREEPGIARADQACSLVLTRKRKRH
ncbi:MAG: ribonuclease HI [Candidatus Sericytochromatia bacterium]